MWHSVRSAELEEAWEMLGSSTCVHSQKKQRKVKIASLSQSLAERARSPHPTSHPKRRSSQIPWPRCRRAGCRPRVWTCRELTRALLLSQNTSPPSERTHAHAIHKRQKVRRRTTQSGASDRDNCDESGDAFPAALSFLNPYRLRLATGCLGPSRLLIAS